MIPTKGTTYVRCQNDECKRLLPEGTTMCVHCCTVVMKRRPDPIREALVLLVIRINEIKGDWTESLDTAMQQAEQALNRSHPDYHALMRMAAEPAYTCTQHLEFARDFLDSADTELQEAFKTASGLACLLLLDMIRETCTMAARTRAILTAASNEGPSLLQASKSDGSGISPPASFTTLSCSKCGTPVNVMGRAVDGSLHPGKACEEGQ